MFKPQGWSLTPRKKVGGSGSDPNFNGVAEPVTPNGNGGLGSQVQEGFAEKLSRLENEVFCWQYIYFLIFILVLQICYSCYNFSFNLLGLGEKLESNYLFKVERSFLGYLG